MNEVSFAGLVASLYFACWQQLGKMANPITGKIEKNIDQAKNSIDMLIMLKEKTKGNLAGEEQKSLDEAISSLQLNYVDEVNRQEKDGKTQDAKEQETKEETKDESKAREA